MAFSRSNRNKRSNSISEGDLGETGQYHSATAPVSSTSLATLVQSLSQASFKSASISRIVSFRSAVSDVIKLNKVVHAFAGSDPNLYRRSSQGALTSDSGGKSGAETGRSVSSFGGVTSVETVVVDALQQKKSADDDASLEPEEPCCKCKECLRWTYRVFTIILSRILFILHSGLLIWQVANIFGPIYWLACMIQSLMLADLMVVLFGRKGVEWKW